MPHALVPDHAFGVRQVSVRGFRSLRSVELAPGPVCALVGGPSVGKSNLLAAIWILLQQGAPAPAAEDVARQDVAHGQAGSISLRARLGDGDEVALQTSPPAGATASGRSIPVLFLPASLRSDGLVSEPIGDPLAAAVARDHLQKATGASSAAPAAALVTALEALLEGGERGLVLLIEEPELFLRPQAQRYLYRLLRAFAHEGNQAIYSTHAPAFLNVGRLDEVALVEYLPGTGTGVIQPEPLPAMESFRAVSEIDAERGELFLARAVLIVEGRTEKLTLPFVFRALGEDPDREGISIVECGGKPNMPLFIHVCRAARIPFLAVHDRDAAPGQRPSRSEHALNAEIAELAGPHRVELAPDFEAVAGLRGHRHKPARAWERFSQIERGEVPGALRLAVERIVALAQAR